MRADVEPDDAVERTPHLRRISARIVIAALGVVFGDLGTSPLYTFAAIAEATGSKLDRAAALGSLSLVFWTLIITSRSSTAYSSCGPTMTAKAASSR